MGYTESGAELLLLVFSRLDTAGVCIAVEMLSAGGWEDAGTFSGSVARRRGGFILVSIGEHHLERDNVDKSVTEELGIDLDGVIYLSKHKSGSGRKSLTVHPIGNFGKAEFGGKDSTLVHAMPHAMTAALRMLNACAKSGGLDYSVSFEATHHGPILESPTFFIEIGSTETEWSDRTAARAIGDAILGIKEETCPVAIGIGGGHYAPRITDIALARKVSFGHIVPTYALDTINEKAICMAVEKTPRARLAYIHRNALKTGALVMAEKTCRGLGLEIIGEDDLEKYS